MAKRIVNARANAAANTGGIPAGAPGNISSSATSAQQANPIVAAPAGAVVGKHMGTSSSKRAGNLVGHVTAQHRAVRPPGGGAKGNRPRSSMDGTASTAKPGAGY